MRLRLDVCAHVPVHPSMGGLAAAIPTLIPNTASFDVLTGWAGLYVLLGSLGLLRYCVGLLEHAHRT